MFETLLDCLSKKQSRKGRTALKWANVPFNNPHQAWRGIQALANYMARAFQPLTAASNLQRSSTPSLLSLRPPLVLLVVRK